jgi:hypothetical protein
MQIDSDSKKIILFISVLVTLFILLGIVNKGYKNTDSELSENNNTLLICLTFFILGLSMFYIGDVVGYMIVCGFVVMLFL